MIFPPQRFFRQSGFLVIPEYHVFPAYKMAAAQPLTREITGVKNLRLK
jgi:hypothetical protein